MKQSFCSYGITGNNCFALLLVITIPTIQQFNSSTIQQFNNYTSIRLIVDSFNRLDCQCE